MILNTCLHGFVFLLSNVLLVMGCSIVHIRPYSTLCLLSHEWSVHIQWVCKKYNFVGYTIFVWRLRMTRFSQTNSLLHWFNNSCPQYVNIFEGSWRQKCGMGESVVNLTLFDHASCAPTIAEREILDLPIPPAQTNWFETHTAHAIHLWDICPNI